MQPWVHHLHLSRIFYIIFQKHFQRESQRSSYILSPKGQRATLQLQHDAISRINDMQDSVQRRTALLIYAAEREDTVLIYTSKASKDSSSRLGEQTKGNVPRVRESERQTPEDIRERIDALEGVANVPVVWAGLGAYFDLWNFGEWVENLWIRVPRSLIYGKYATVCIHVEKIR